MPQVSLPVIAGDDLFRGSYDQISTVNEAVAAWVEDNGWTFDGLFFNIYH